MNWRLIRVIDTYIGIPVLCMFAMLRRAFFGRMSELPTEKNFRRVLAVKFWGIGNVFMLLPSIYALREKHKDCSVSLLTLKINKEAAESTLLFDKVYMIDTSGARAFLRSSARVLRELRAMDFDLVIDFEQFARFSALVSAYVGRQSRRGFVTAGQHRHYLYTSKVGYVDSGHMTRSFYSLVAPSGVGEMRLPVPLPLVEVLRRRVIPVLSALKSADEAGPVVVIHAGTSENFRDRRWPAEYFACLADGLASKHRARLIFTGLGDEVELVSSVIARMQHKESALDLSGRLAFRDLLAIICQSDMVISADTATVHLASALGTPVVGLYGPNTPELYGPWGGGDDLFYYSRLQCSPCITNFNSKVHTCRHPEGRGACMHKIFPEEVLRGIEERFFPPGRAHIRHADGRAGGLCDAP